MRLNRGKLEVFFELKKKDIGHELMYEFDVNNHLIIAGKTSCFDVSNGISPDERYVRIATGPDYASCAPISGMRMGSAGESMIVSVQVQQ